MSIYKGHSLDFHVPANNNEGMGKSRILEYQAKYADQMIRFNPYAIKKMGLVQSQTLVKIEDYMLICAPFQMSMKRAIMLVILSREETTFFQQFQKKMCSINFTFQRPNNKTPINFFVRGILDRLGAVKGKQNVCMLDISFKNCPVDLVEIIGDYITSFESLKAQYESFKGKEIPMNPRNAKIMRFNNFVESQFGKNKVQTRLLAVSVDKLILAVPASVPDLSDGMKFVSKLYFQVYQFIVGGIISKMEGPMNGYYKVHYDIDFSPELVEIIDDYFFRLSMQKKG